MNPIAKRFFRVQANLILGIALVGCATSELEFSTETVGCSNWDFNNPENSYLQILRDGNDVLVSRQGVIQQCDAQFTASYSVDDYKIHIRENWVLPEGNSDCEVCLAPTVRIVDYQEQELEFWWYEGDDNIAFGVVQTSELED